VGKQNGGIKMKKKWKRVSLVTAIVIGLILTGCGKQSANQKQASEDSQYKYGTVEIPCLDGALCGAPLYVAYENGYFKEEGIDAKLIAADTETRKIGLNNGTYPITNGDFMFFQSIEQGVETTVVDGLHNGCIKILVKNGSNVKQASDLKGKKIGVDEIGGPPYEAASIWLEAGGVSAKEKDGEITFLPYADGNLQLEALYSGEVDAVAIWDPLASAAVKSGKAVAVCDLLDNPVFAGKFCCFVYASNKVLEEKPDEVAALLRAIHKAEQWINDNPEKTVQIVADGNYSEIEDTNLAVELLKEYVYPTEEEIAANAHDVGADVSYFAEQLNRVGYLTTDPDALIKKLYTKVDISK